MKRLKGLSLMNSCLLAVLMLICFAGLANAQILVGIGPKDKSRQFVSLFPEEVVQMEVTVLNSGPEPAPVVLKMFAGSQLAFIEMGAETKGLAEELFLGPGEKQILELEVKSQGYSEEKQVILVTYGIEDFSQSLETIVKLLPEKLYIETTLPVTINNRGSFEAKVTNKGKEQVQNLKLEIIPQIGIDSETEPFILGVLLPEETVEKNFDFFVTQNLDEGKTIVFQASFADVNGSHVFHRQLEVQSRNESGIIVTAALILIALVILFVATKLFGRKPKKEEKPENPEKTN